tara:strand:+ start:234 stop:728 length:495 start_codon:yes stop_codon:yes gene_type:complete
MIKKINKKELLEMISEAVTSQSKTIQGFPSELPVGIDRTKALSRYGQEMASLKAQIASATDSSVKSALKGELQDVSDEHEALAKSSSAAITESGISAIRKIFEKKGLSLKDRIDTLETLLDKFILKDDQGAGYVDRIAQVEKNIESLMKNTNNQDQDEDPDKVL